MKKVILLLITLSILSCSKNDEGSVDASEKQLSLNFQNVSGKWYYSSIIKPNGATVAYTNLCSTNKDYADFFVYRKITSHRFFQDCGEGISDCYDYWFDGNRIKSCSDDFNNGRVTSLTATTMKIEFDDVRSFGGISSDGAKALILTK